MPARQRAVAVSAKAKVLVVPARRISIPWTLEQLAPPSGSDFEWWHWNSHEVISLSILPEDANLECLKMVENLYINIKIEINHQKSDL